MTGIANINLYDILLRNFKTEDEARTFVKELDIYVEDRVLDKTKTLTSKDDIEVVKSNIEHLKFQIEEVKQQNIRTQLEIEKRFNSQILWLIGVVFSAGALFITIAKLLF